MEEKKVTYWTLVVDQWYLAFIYSYEPDKETQPASEYQEFRKSFKDSSLESRFKKVSKERFYYI